MKAPNKQCPGIKCPCKKCSDKDCPCKKRLTAKLFTSSASSESRQRLLASLKKYGGKAYKDYLSENPMPNNESLKTVETKILAGDKPDRGDRQAIALILKEFERLSKIVRALSNHSGNDGQFSTISLLQQTFENVERLHEIDKKRMASIACTINCFPVIASPGAGSTKKINGQLSDLHVGRAYQAGCYTTAKSPPDLFSEIADIIFDDLIEGGLPIQHVTDGDWKMLQPRVRECYLPCILDELSKPDRGDVFNTDPAIRCHYDRLVRELKAERDLKTKGSTKERIKEKILARLWAKLGRGKGIIPELPQSLR